MPNETRFDLLVPWSPPSNPAGPPSERTGPFAVLVRGSYPTAAECHVWAREHLRGEPYIVREIRTDGEDSEHIDRPSHLFPVLHDGTPRAFTSVGCYPLIYVTRRGEVLCAACAHTGFDEHDPVVAVDVFYEGASEFCADCNAEIESAYGDPDVERA